MKRYILIAGVNGAGKTTLYEAKIAVYQRRLLFWQANVLPDWFEKWIRKNKIN